MMQVDVPLWLPRKPALDDKLLYVKILLRADCIVVSFREDLAET
jgi:hypothetical protein